jgi:hypothetical protein
MLRALMMKRKKKVQVNLVVSLVQNVLFVGQAY